MSLSLWQNWWTWDPDTHTQRHRPIRRRRRIFLVIDAYKSISNDPYLDSRHLCHWDTNLLLWLKICSKLPDIYIFDQNSFYHDRWSIHYGTFNNPRLVWHSRLFNFTFTRDNISSQWPPHGLGTDWDWKEVARSTPEVHNQIAGTSEIRLGRNST